VRIVHSETSHRRALVQIGKNAIAALLGLLFVLVAIELGLRLVQRTNDSRRLVYPKVANDINGFRDRHFGRRVPAGQFRILMLGASAFVTRNFAPAFEQLLNGSGWFHESGKRARVISTGVPAHMTYDSLWKYRDWYRDYDFDLVIYYHGINDARANCYPPDVFRDDYSMMPYFAQYAPAFAWVEHHPILSRSFAATFTVAALCRARVRVAPRFQRQDPYNDPRNDRWLTEGKDIKTAAAFERNLEAVIAIARERRQRLLVLTYAYYVPPNYSNRAFLERRLDYDFKEESIAIEVWGIPENVVRAIDTHNDIVRRVCARHPEVLFFDMEKYMPKDGQHFIDICHWTDRGRERFTAGILEVQARLQ